MRSRTFGYRDGVAGGENKFAFAAERARCGNSGAQGLIATAIDFQELAGTAVNLLANDSAEANGVRELQRGVHEANRFGSKREERGAAAFRCLPLQRAAACNTIV